MMIIMLIIIIIMITVIPNRKGGKWGQHTNGVTAHSMFFGRGTFGGTPANLR